MRANRRHSPTIARVAHASFASPALGTLVAQSRHPAVTRLENGEEPRPGRVSPHAGDQPRPALGEAAVWLPETLEEGALLRPDAEDEPGGGNHDDHHQGCPVAQCQP